MVDERTEAALARAREILDRRDLGAEAEELEARRRANRIAEIMARPPASTAGTQWRDIGDGWEELSVPKPSGDRVIRGIASSTAINTHGYAVDPMGMTCTLPIPLRSNHDLEGKGIGVVYMFRRNAKQVYYEAVVHHGHAADYAWQLIADGTFKCVSLGWENRHDFKTEAVVNGVRFLKQWPGGELSLCSRGANPDATCSIHDGRPWREYLGIIELHKTQSDIVYRETATQ